MASQKTYRQQQRRAKNKGGNPWIYVLAVILCAVMACPVAYVAVGGFRTQGQINESPSGLPDPLVTENYTYVFTEPRHLFFTQLKNSAIIATITTVLVVALGMMVAFILSRYHFKGRGALYALFAAGLMFPLTVAALPIYLVMAQLGLVGNILGVILPQVAFALPVTVVVLVPFLRAIPVELEEAATIDGTSRIGFFWRILLPLSGPGAVTVAVLAFLGSWNGYMLPMLILGGKVNNYTLPLGVANFNSEHSADMAKIMAYTSICMIPALLLFTLLQRRIVSGLTGAVKG